MYSLYVGLTTLAIIEHTMEMKYLSDNQEMNNFGIYSQQGLYITEGIWRMSVVLEKYGLAIT